MKRNTLKLFLFISMLAISFNLYARDNSRDGIFISSGLVNRTAFIFSPSKPPFEKVLYSFHKNRAKLRQAYLLALRKQPDIKGKIIFEFEINSKNQVIYTRKAKSTLNNIELEKKLDGLVAKFRYRSVRTKLQTVYITVTFILQKTI